MTKTKAGRVRLLHRDARAGSAEYLLDNGLKLIVCPRHHAPVVTVMTWYRTGSRDEHANEYGAAHFVEHMMFKGTRHLPKGAIDRKTQWHGGHNNAFTSHDHTSYLFELSTRHWPLALEIESSRMRDCLFAPREVDSERSVILEELQRYQEQPWPYLMERVECTLYPQHPYGRPVVGDAASLRAMRRSDLLGFYRRFYTPGQAFVVVAGDVREEDVVSETVRRLGPLAGEGGPREEFSVVMPEGERRLSLARPVQAARLALGYRTCRVGESGDYILDVIEQILCGGRSSRLVSRFVEQRRLVRWVGGQNEARTSVGHFLVMAELMPGISPSLFEEELLGEIDRLAREGVTPAELEKARANVTAGFLYDLERSLSVATKIGIYEAAGAGAGLTRYLKAVLAVTRDQVREAAQKYFLDVPRVIGWSLPEGKLGQGRGVETGSRGLPAARTRSGGAGGAGSASSPLVSMSWKPSALPSGRPERLVLKNGLRVLYLHRPHLPVVSLRVFVDAGMEWELPALAGVARLTSHLLAEGTKKRDKAAIDEELETVGGSMELASTGLTLRLRTGDAPRLFALAAELLTQPSFIPEALQKGLERQRAELAMRSEDGARVGRQVFDRLVYGRHPYGRAPLGTRQTLARIDRATVQGYWRKHYVPGRTLIGVVGALPREELRVLLEKTFGRWGGEAPPLPRLPLLRRQREEKRKILAVPGEQLHLFLGHLGVRRTHPDFDILTVMDHLLGSGEGFTDRISKRLRDEEGLVYTVTAGISSTAGLEPGVFAAYLATSPRNEKRVIREIREEIFRLQRDGITDEELAAARSYLVGSYVFDFETNFQWARYLLFTERMGLPFDYWKSYPERIGRITAADVRRVARENLDPRRMTVVCVRPKMKRGGISG